MSQQTSSSFGKLHHSLTLSDALEANLRRAADGARGPFKSVPKRLRPGDRLKNAEKFLEIIRAGLNIIETISALGWDSQGIQQVMVLGLPKQSKKTWSAYLTKILRQDSLTASALPAKGSQPEGVLVHLKQGEAAYVCVNFLSRQLLHLARVVGGTQPDFKTVERYVWIPKSLGHILSAHGVPYSRYGDFVYVNAANAATEFQAADDRIEGKGKEKGKREARGREVHEEGIKAIEGLRRIMRASYLPEYQSVERLPLYSGPSQAGGK
ncbi:hypothetical protein HDV00_005008 [Rhizophlyctis rosea]|nr:hypothetical protein HDV00_005008 [Rhizophlyctis rosea]